MTKAYDLEATFNDKAVKQLLKEITGNFNKIEKKDKEVIGLMSAIVYRDVMDHFKKEQGPNGGWQEWSDSYKAVLSGQMHFRFFNNRIIPLKGPDPSRSRPPPQRKLQDTGRLRDSFLPKNVRTESDSIVWYNPAKTSKGFPYAAAHDVGGPILPQRRFMWLSDGSINDIESQILKYLEGE